MTSPPPGTDLARLVTFLETAGYQRVPAGNSYLRDAEYRTEADPGIVRPHRGGPEFSYHWSVELGQGAGYNSFFCMFYFEESGKLIAHGVWE